MDSFDYRGRYAYHIILLTQGRAPYFTDRSLGRRCIERLARAAGCHGFRLLAFCFMPSHLHALVLGRDDDSDLIRFVRGFKQVTAFDFKRETGLRLWQQSFYDRALRVEEDLADVAAYILNNPLQSGLAGDSSEYALCGGEYLEADGAGGADGDAPADGAEAPSLRPSPTSAAPSLAGGRHG